MGSSGSSSSLNRAMPTTNSKTPKDLPKSPTDVETITFNGQLLYRKGVDDHIIRAFYKEGSYGFNLRSTCQKSGRNFYFDWDIRGLADIVVHGPSLHFEAINPYEIEWIAPAKPLDPEMAIVQCFESLNSIGKVVITFRVEVFPEILANVIMKLLEKTVRSRRCRLRASDHDGR